MVRIKIGNILDCQEDIIVHQVNVQGVMGGGVARQLATHYKGLDKEYSNYCRIFDNDYNQLKGSTFTVFLKNKFISNIFSQTPEFNTDYEEMKKCLNYIKLHAKTRNRTVCMPYRIGCGIANGDWDIVYKIIEDVFYDYEVTLYKLNVNNKKEN